MRSASLPTTRSIAAALVLAASGPVFAQDKTPTVVPSPPLNSQPPATPTPVRIPTAASTQIPDAPGATPGATTIAKPLNLADFDSDKSGTVSTDEFLAYHAERLMKLFDTLDADKDGNLTQTELAKVQRRTTTYRGAQPGAGPAATSGSPIPPAPAKPPVDSGAP